MDNAVSHDLFQLTMEFFSQGPWQEINCLIPNFDPERGNTDVGNKTKHRHPPLTGTWCNKTKGKFVNLPGYRDFGSWVDVKCNI